MRMLKHFVAVVLVVGWVGAGCGGGSGTGSGGGNGGGGGGGGQNPPPDGGTTGTLPVNAVAAAPICPGSGVVIGPEPTAGYTYAWSPPQGLSATDVARPTAAPSATTTYRVTVTNPATGETGAGTVVVNVFPRPKADPGPDRARCSAGSVTLGAPAVPGLVYKWAGPGLKDVNAAQPTVAFSGTATYTLQVTDAHACTDTKSVTVAMAQPPVARISVFGGASLAANLCPGSTLMLSGVGSSTAAPASVVAYQWTFGSASSSEPIPTFSVPDGNAPVPVQLTVADSNGCTATASTQVALFPRPKANAGPDKTTGDGGAVTVGQPATGGQAPYTYAWTSSDSTCRDAPCLSGVTDVSPRVSPNQDTTFSVVATDSRGCRSLPDAVQVSISSGLTANAGPDRTFCTGQSTNIGLRAGGGSPPYRYAWTSNIACSAPDCISRTNTATVSVAPTATTVFTQTVTDADDAMASASVTVNVVASPGVTGPDQFLDAGKSAVIGPAPVSGGRYAWSCNQPDCALSSTSAARPVASPTHSTRYTLTASNAGDCELTSGMTLWVNIGYTTVPADGMKTFPVNSVLQVQFNQAIRAETLNRDTVLLRNVATDLRVPVTLHYDASSYLLTITPPERGHNGYTEGGHYALTLMGGQNGILSDDWMPNILSSDRTISFDTVHTDGAAPVVAESALAALHVPANAAVTASFDEPVDPRTVNARSFQVSSGAARIPGTVTYDFVHRTATFLPAGGLAPGSDYAVSLSGVTDLAGNAVQTGWTFTASAPEVASEAAVHPVEAQAPAR